MATIESLGAALFRRLEQSGQTRKVSLPRHEPKAAEVVDLPMSNATKPAPKEAKLPGASSNEVPHAETGSSSRPNKHREPVTLEELAVMLHKVNLTFDLFEVQANYSVDPNTGNVTIEVINQRTGEVIRRIPPYDIPDVIRAIDENQNLGSMGPLITDIKA